MEKVYMEAPKRSYKTWRAEDISPYDFKDDETKRTQENQIPLNRNTQERNENRTNYYSNEEDEYELDAIMDEMNRIDDEMENECYHENDMYENGNIDWRWNEDVSQNPRNMSIDRKTIVEEENPKRTTTTWMRVRRQY